MDVSRLTKVRRGRAEHGKVGASERQSVGKRRRWKSGDVGKQSGRDSPHTQRPPKVAQENEVGGSESRGTRKQSRSSQEGVPLTITPPLGRHRPDAWIGREIGRKGIEPKAIFRIRRGAAGLRW